MEAANEKEVRATLRRIVLATLIDMRRDVTRRLTDAGTHGRIISAIEDKIQRLHDDLANDLR